MEELLRAIEKLTEAIEKSNGFNLSEWVLIIITLVYVVATIAIYRANIKSAKAAQEQNAELKRQLDETKRQFDETNRPVVEVTLEAKKVGIHFVFHNTGNRYAKNVGIKFNNAFIEKYSKIYPFESSVKESFLNIDKSVFNLGVGQIYSLFICKLVEHTKLGVAEVEVIYKDDNGREYSAVFIFDLEKDNWRAID